jgi:D-hydroxyproline dehydrogenase subunit beta
MPEAYDLAIIGGGIIGLAHAYTAAKRGKKVVVIERDTRAVGASIRNFGFITVTGQARHTVWPVARRSRDIWADIAGPAGIEIEHRGLLLTARYPESVEVLDAFMQTEMGEDCALLTPAELRAKHPQICGEANLRTLWSPHELRVESRTAIPKITSWLAREHGVTFETGTAALNVAPPRVETSRGLIMAEAAIVCPGDDFHTLFPDRIAAYQPTRCILTMLRLANPGFILPAGIMSDLGLVRYEGYAALPEAAALKDRIAREHRQQLDHGVHLIVVQCADGSLIVGDSHHYDPTPWPFAAAESEALILDEFRSGTGIASPPVIERWTGSYSSAAEPYFVDTPADDVRIVMITSGTGASMSFGLAERVITDLYGGTQ